MSQVKTVVELPLETFNEIKETQQRIIRALESLKVLTPVQPTFLTALEFMKKCKISRGTFDALRDQNRINVRKVGRKIYVPASEVDRFFDGKM